MNQTIEALLKGEVENHLMPFFWQHGESEETLREYVGAIQGANCQEFCVESRPHPDFVGEQWWHDMDIILDEASKRNMRVWILDDSHFPTGYAAGAMKQEDTSLKRQSVFCHFRDYGGEEKEISFPLEKYSHPPKYKGTVVEKILMKLVTKGCPKYDDDHLISITAFGENGEMIDLTGVERWKKPKGKWQVAFCGLSRNLGPHREYINMMDQESVSCLIKAVYEAHYEHYKNYFGNVIAGFFSDEPELGNGIMYRMHNVLGTDQDLPWSRELHERLGNEFFKMLPLLWKNDYDFQVTAKTRNIYMDAVSDLVSKDFSFQVGDWCREHGVSYIGHSIEDSDTSACTGSGLGHYFRGLAGQDMAGIDDIGSQVMPGCEEKPDKNMMGIRNGGFYHYTLGKLGASAAAIEPLKKGRAMCEIFGNYGWSTGVYDMKYLADHFLVRGINYFVPHAFSPKEYPDTDCPPHFYAHGNNPQYRHFGELCGYMNRVSNIFSDGKNCSRIAVLYNAEAEWAGETMLLNKPARELIDHQIDFLFLPMDRLDLAEQFEYLIVPYGRYYPDKLEQIKNALYLEKLPENFKKGEVIALESLAQYLSEKKLNTINISPANPWIHCIHYKKQNDIFMIINEGENTFHGTVTLPVSDTVYQYDAWENKVLSMTSRLKFQGEYSEFNLEIEPRKSLILIGDSTIMESEQTEPLVIPENKMLLKEWKRSICAGKKYPEFTEEKEVTLPDHLEKEKKKFSGFVRYEKTVQIDNKNSVLVITDAAEGVEVFVNDVSLGIQIVPNFVYNLSDYALEGENRLRIEVATTLEREASSVISQLLGSLTGGKGIKSKSGITGNVFLCS